MTVDFTHSPVRGRIFAFVAMALLICTQHSGTGQEPGQEQGREPEIYYIAVNIWCADPRQISTTNYHAGQIIPVGTRVTLNRIGGINIVFSTDDKKTFTIVHILKHSSIKLDEVFTRLFDTKDALAPGGTFHGLTKEEQKGVAEGTIYEGMSKAAVLMAYGYPPSHRTPDLAGKVWTYWLSRMGTVEVKFNDDGKVESVRGLPRAAPKEGRK